MLARQEDSEASRFELDFSLDSLDRVSKLYRISSVVTYREARLMADVDSLSCCCTMLLYNKDLPTDILPIDFASALREAKVLSTTEELRARSIRSMLRDIPRE